MGYVTAYWCVIVFKFVLFVFCLFAVVFVCWIVIRVCLFVCLSVAGVVDLDFSIGVFDIVAYWRLIYLCNSVADIVCSFGDEACLFVVLIWRCLRFIVALMLVDVVLL